MTEAGASKDAPRTSSLYKSLHEWIILDIVKHLCSDVRCQKMTNLSLPDGHSRAKREKPMSLKDFELKAKDKYGSQGQNLALAFK